MVGRLSATIWRNSMWQDKTQVKKGSFGEKIVRNYLEGKGFVIYEPLTNGAHAFDKLAIKNKRTILIVEVKSKARMNYYNATGINIKHFNEYKFISKKYNLPVYLFFVDEMLGKIYGNKLSKLLEPVEDDLKYPNTDKVKDIILFSLNSMVDIYTLTEAEIDSLKELSTRKYDYRTKEIKTIPQ